jgi:hypothetical protein
VFHTCIAASANSAQDEDSEHRMFVVEQVTQVMELTIELHPSTGENFK